MNTNSSRPSENRENFLRSSKILLTLLVAFSGITAVFYLGLYVTSLRWQALAATGLMFGGAMLALVIYQLLKRGNTFLTGITILVAVAVGYGSNEIFWSGLFIYHIIGGSLLVLLTGVFLLPQKYGYWAISVAIYIAYVVGINSITPIERLGPVELPALLPYAIGTNILMITALVASFLYTQLKGTIRTRLRISFALMALVPIIILGVISSYNTSQISSEKAMVELNNVATQKQSVIQAWVSSLENSFLLILPVEWQSSRMIQVLTDQGPEPDYSNFIIQQRTNFERLLNESDRYQALLILNLDGDVVFSTEPALLGVNLASEEYTIQGQQRFYVSTPYIPPGAQTPLVMAAYPIQQSDGQTVGIMVIRLSLQNIVNEIEATSSLTSSQETYLINAENILLTRTRTGLEAGIEYFFEDWPTLAIAARQSGSGQYANYNEEIVFGTYQWLPDMQVLLVTQRDALEAMSTATQTIIFNILLGIGTLTLSLLVSWYATNRITRPVDRLVKVAQTAAGGDLTVRAEVEDNDEIGALVVAFNSMTDQLSSQVASLEQRVAERTRSLERRSRQIQVAAEVARDASASREMNTLLNRAVELLRERFRFNQASIYLVNESQDHAVLKATAGHTSFAAPLKEHRLRMDPENLVAYAATAGQVRIAAKTIQDSAAVAGAAVAGAAVAGTPVAGPSRGPFAGLVQYSEMALPLKSGDQTLGVLDICSVEGEPFTQDDAVIVQILADQLAVAIENIRLLQEVQESLYQVETLYTSYSQRSWRQLAEQANLMGYQYDEQGVTPLLSQEPRREAGMQGWSERERGSAQEGSAQGSVMVPLKVRGQEIGTLEIWPNSEPWSEDQQALLNALSDRVSQAMESARLYQESQLRAANEQMVSEITSQIRSTLDMDAVLQTTIQEIRRALDLQEVEIRLGFEEEPLSPEAASK